MSSKCLLIIDDEVDIREIAKLGLTITKQWEILTASSGQEGIDLAVQTSPDAILLDLIMPGIGGIETLKSLKSNPKTAHIPIIFLTATAKLVMKPEYANWGAKGILVKPFDPGLLGDQVEQLLAWNIPAHS